MTNSKKVLIFEDDKFISSAYRLKFENEGFTVKTVQDGQEGLNVLKEFLPDVILLDIIMPVMDGFTALSEIKKDSKTKDIPVIITSNLGQKEDIDKGKELGATDYIVKTETAIEDIVSKVNSLIK